MLKLGVMGCGIVARYGHLPALAKVPAIRVQALFEPHPGRLQEICRLFPGPAAFSDQDAFLRTDLDAVTICSPAPCHLDNVLAAARHRKHVLCEKPLAPTEADIERMRGAMADAGLKLYAGFTYRFSPVAQTIRRLVNENAIGPLRSIRLLYLWNLHGQYMVDPAGQRELNHRRVGRMVEGGPLVDCGVHFIDLARWWTRSEIVRQQAFGMWYEDFPAPGHVCLHMDHASGVHTMVETSFCYTHTSPAPRSQFLYELVGADGLIRYDGGRKVFELRNSIGLTPLEWHEPKNFAGMYAAFAAAIQTGQNGDLPTADDGLIATRIARQATEQCIADRAARTTR